jgi:hypothetical protein
MCFQAYLPAKDPAIILLVASYWCENWSLTPRSEHRSRVFDSRMLRKILGLKWEEETRDWNKSHEEEFHDSFLIKYYDGNQIQEVEINEACCMWHVWMWRNRRKNTYRILAGKLQGKKQLVRSRRRRGDNINMNLQEIGQMGVHWTDLAQDRGQCWVPVNAIMNLWVPLNAENNFTIRGTVDF